VICKQGSSFLVTRFLTVYILKETCLIILLFGGQSGIQLMLYCFNSSHLLIMSSLDINIVDVLFAHLSYRLSIFKALIYLHVLFSSVFCYAYIPCKKNSCLLQLCQGQHYDFDSYLMYLIIIFISILLCLYTM
jgi:hypothetical protein